MKRQIYVFLFDGFSDWEIAYLAPEIAKDERFEMIYFSKDGLPVRSMGGMQVLPDRSLKEIDVNEVELLILPGGTAWQMNKNREIDSLITELFASNVLIAAICGATFYLAEHGFLDNLKHTSNDLSCLRMFAPNYKGDQNYIYEAAVCDRNMITASGIAPIEFAKEVFKALKLHSEKDIEKWFQLFKNGVWEE